MIAQGPIALSPIAGIAGGSALPAVEIRAAVTSPLGAPSAVVAHDFTAFVGDSVTQYVMDLVTPGGLVRVPISSWQATLQVDRANYAQCVVPACTPWVDAIAAATEFVISRRAVRPDGTGFEYVMVRSPVGQAAFDRGPTRHTATLSGYGPGFAGGGDPPAIYDRELSGVRSTSAGATSIRARCAIDWLLRPGHRAFLNGSPFAVSYINFYVMQWDAYCDVGGAA